MNLVEDVPRGRELRFIPPLEGKMHFTDHFGPQCVDSKMQTQQEQTGMMRLISWAEVR